MPFAATRDAVPRNARRLFGLERTLETILVPALLRCEGVTVLTGLVPDEIEREVKQGLFPPPVRLTPGDTTDALGWNSGEIAVVNAAKTCGATCEQLRQVVARLMADRIEGAAMLAQSPVAKQPSTHGAN